MKWIKTHEPKLSENYLEIHYSNMNKETQDIITYLESKNVLMGRNDTESRLIKPDEIYYCEIVDRKCYAYLREEVWNLEEVLADLTERYLKMKGISFSVMYDNNLPRRGFLNNFEM